MGQPARLRPNGSTPRERHDHLVAGGVIPFPDGRMLRASGPAETCTTCAGSGKDADYRWIDPPDCYQCDGIGKRLPIEFVPDPMVLAPWTGATYRIGKGIAERHTLTGERVAFVANKRGTISTTIVTDDRLYTIALTITAPGGDHENRLWESALRLADAELRALGYGT